MTDPASAETYPQYMMLDGEQEREDEAWASGYRFAPILPPNPEMVEAFLRRANENAETCQTSHHYYLLTGKGRVAAERLDAAARAQIERTKEPT